jgi:hypothetical protein
MLARRCFGYVGTPLLWLCWHVAAFGYVGTPLLWLFWHAAVLAMLARRCFSLLV